MEAIQGIEKALQGLQLHPVADHFTIALLTIAVLIDLVASLFPARAWLRNTALTLMVLGALAAAASFSTGDMESDRVWNMMSPDAKKYFKGAGVDFLGHGALGYYLMFVFGGLALWRILIALFNFMAGSRPLYLILAVTAMALLLYQGHTGGELVYSFGVGTGPMAAGMAPAAVPTPGAAATAVSAASATPVPTVFVPTPEATSTPAALGSAGPTPSAAPATPAAARPTASAKPHGR